MAAQGILLWVGRCVQLSLDLFGVIPTVVWGRLHMRAGGRFSVAELEPGTGFETGRAYYFHTDDIQYVVKGTVQLLSPK